MQAEMSGEIVNPGGVASGEFDFKNDAVIYWRSLPSGAVGVDVDGLGGLEAEISVKGDAQRVASDAFTGLSLITNTDHGFGSQV